MGGESTEQPEIHLTALCNNLENEPLYTGNGKISVESKSSEIV